MDSSRYYVIRVEEKGDLHKGGPGPSAGGGSKAPARKHAFIGLGFRCVCACVRACVCVCVFTVCVCVVGGAAGKLSETVGLALTVGPHVMGGTGLHVNSCLTVTCSHACGQPKPWADSSCRPCSQSGREMTRRACS